MAATGWHRLETVFFEALDLAPADRSAYLDRVCGQDDNLRREIEAMLSAHEDNRELRIEKKLLAVEEPESHGLVGQRLGPWMLTEPLGRGGTAEVYVAERADGHFHRRVAIKVVQPGWGPVELAERLRVEREILAALDHPAIATLFDGGITENGQPYLVMELVEGLEITEFCDSRQASVDERLHLFVEVCRAVQFAHGSLVVHRDLKPSNILVTPEGTPKLLDFGIAKLLDAELFDLDVEATRHELRLLTPRRAAPEQFAGGPITTATDVWGLGVLLLELLTSTLPHQDSGIVDAYAFERRICTRPADRPSVVMERIDGEVASDIAENRQTKPQRLARRLRGDLDRIVGMALRLEPERRYASAGQLADDVERVLRDEPVAARPETWAYRSGRFIRRHRLAVGVVAVAAALLVGATAVTSVQSRIAARERDRAQAERDRAETVVELLVGMLGQADPVEGPGGDVLAVADLLAYGELRAESLGDRPELQATLYANLGKIHGARSRHDDGRRLLESALAIRETLGDPLDQEVVEILDELGRIAAAQDRQADARTLLRRASSLAEAVHGPIHPVTAETMQNLAMYGETDPEVQEQLVVRVTEIWAEVDGDTSVGRASALSALAQLRHDRGNRASALALYREAYELLAEELGDDHPETLSTLGNLASLLDDPHEAVEVRRHILAANARRYGDASVQNAIAWNNLGTSLAILGEHSDARKAFFEALQRWQTVYGPEHSQVANTARNIGRTYVLEGRNAEALVYLDRAARVMPTSEQDRAGSTFDFLQSQRSLVLARLGQRVEGLRQAEHAVAVFRQRAEEGDIRYLSEALVNLGLVRMEWGGGPGTQSAFEEAAILLEQQFGADHPKVAEARCGAAVAASGRSPSQHAACQPLQNWGLADPVLRP